MTIGYIILIIWIIWALCTIIYWIVDKSPMNGYERFLRIPVLLIGPLILLLPLADYLLSRKKKDD